MKILRGQKGEGLISVLISVAILGVLIVTVVTMYQMFGQMMAKSVLRREADEIAARVRGLLLTRKLCQQTLVPNKWDGVTETNIVLWDGAGGKSTSASWMRRGRPRQSLGRSRRPDCRSTCCRSSTRSTKTTARCCY